MSIRKTNHVWSEAASCQRESVGGLAPAYITTGHLHTSQPSNDSPARVSMLNQCSKIPNKRSLATLAANLPRKPAISPIFLQLFLAPCEWGFMRVSRSCGNRTEFWRYANAHAVTTTRHFTSKRHNLFKYVDVKDCLKGQRNQKKKIVQYLV